MSREAPSVQSGGFRFLHCKHQGLLLCPSCVLAGCVSAVSCLCLVMCLRVGLAECICVIHWGIFIWICVAGLGLYVWLSMYPCDSAWCVRMSGFGCV